MPIDNAIDVVAIFSHFRHEIEQVFSITKLSWDNVACIRCFHLLCISTDSLQRAFIYVFGAEIPIVCLPVLQLHKAVLSCTIIAGAMRIETDISDDE